LCRLAPAPDVVVDPTTGEITLGPHTASAEMLNSARNESAG
jgi:hypothetical protein